MSDSVVRLPNARSVESFCYPATRPVAFAGRPVGIPREEPALATEAHRQQELASAVSAAREQGMREARAEASAAAAQAIEQERGAIAAAVKDFQRQRAEYFRQVEVEAVRLALSIARRVLHREARMDPLLLSGIVRVAVDQMQAGTRITLRASPDCAAAWRDFCQARADGAFLEVKSDETLQSHHCVLETELGNTEISLEEQLAEIESGFFDSLRQPPETP